jgi:hypothetical protein
MKYLTRTVWALSFINGSGAFMNSEIALKIRETGFLVNLTRAN